MTELLINDKKFQGFQECFANSKLLFIKGEKGVLGCGYFDIEIANKMNELMIIVTGVKNFDDMLNAKVVRVSQKAIELGVKIGMSGKEALLLINE